MRQARGRTLVLDDVANLPLPTQAKLLRVLQERAVEPVGGSTPVPIDVRLVATASVDLEAETRAGRFRSDLYWRLAVVKLEMPPLRARREDLPELCEHFIAALSTRLGSRGASCRRRAWSA
jgi:DNA-binding NtrC family response regulator